MQKIRLQKKVLSIILILAMLLSQSATALAAPYAVSTSLAVTDAEKNDATREKLEEMVRQIITEKIEEILSSDGLVGGVINDFEDFISAQATKLVMDMLGGVEGMVSFVMPLITSALGGIIDFLPADTMEAIINYVVDELLNNVISAILESDFFNKVLERTIEYAVSDAVDYALSEIIYLYGEGNDEEIKALAQKYANEIFGMNYILFSTTTAYLERPYDALVLLPYVFDLVNPFWTIEIIHTGTFGLNREYIITGWQNEANSDAIENVLSWIVNLIPGITVNDLLTMDNYINARLLIDMGLESVGGAIDFDYIAFAAALPDIVWNAFQRAVRDVVIEYLEEYVNLAEVWLAEQISDLLDYVFDWAFGYDAVRNAIRLDPNNFKLMVPVEAVVGNLFEYLFAYLDPNGNHEVSWDSILDDLAVAGLSMLCETERVVMLRLKYQLYAEINELLEESCLDVRLDYLTDSFHDATQKIHTAYKQWICDKTNCRICKLISKKIEVLEFFQDLTLLQQYDGFRQGISEMLTGYRFVLSLCPCVGDCNNGGSGVTTYTVNFNSQGGTAIASISGLIPGSTITAPAPPTRPGFEFLGWYTAASGGRAWNFTDGKVNANTTLYAQWKEITVVMTPFEKAVKEITTKHSPIILPDNLKGNVTGTKAFLEGYIRDQVIGSYNGLAEWQAYISNPAFSAAYPKPYEIPFLLNIWVDGPYDGYFYFMDPDKETTNQLSNHKLNIQYGSVAGETYTVTFYSHGGPPVAPIPNVASGSKISAPLPEPSRAYCSFLGWYTSAANGNKWNFDTDSVTSNITLHAYWLTPYKKAVNKIETEGLEPIIVPNVIKGDDEAIRLYLENKIRQIILDEDADLAIWQNFIYANHPNPGEYPDGEYARLLNIWVYLYTDGNYYFMDPDKEINGQVNHKIEFEFDDISAAAYMAASSTSNSTLTATNNSTLTETKQLNSAKRQSNPFFEQLTKEAAAKQMALWAFITAAVMSLFAPNK